MRMFLCFDFGLVVLVVVVFVGCVVFFVEVMFDFCLDVLFGGEVYLCFGFVLVGDLWVWGIELIEWLFVFGGVVLYYGKLYVLFMVYLVGLVLCD